MSSATDILSFVAVALGSFSTIAVCCLGQKPFNNFMYGFFKNMIWWWIFRFWYNEMIFNKIVENRCLRKSLNSADEALLLVIYYWNPTSKILPQLCKVLELTHNGNIFPLDLICGCA
jgi:hypothetical protein